MARRIGSHFGVSFDSADSSNEAGAAQEPVSPQAEAGDILDMLTGVKPATEPHG